MIDRIAMHMRAMQMLSKAQDATADNLANINTPGFKGNTLFYNMLTEQINGENVTQTTPMTRVNLTQGILEPTGNEFDLGINGDGFFMVEDESGSFLTRDGRFHLDSDGFLVNQAGAKVMGDGGSIQLTDYFLSAREGGVAPRLTIDQDGTVRLNDRLVDQVRMVTVEDASGLERKGNSYFSYRDEGQLTQEGRGSIMQGYYEKGNVEPLNEMVDMMRNMQLFETQQKALRTTDEILSQVTTRLGRL
ncbi:MAG: flagellar hook basal-body protein [Bacteroidota bacterium]